MAAPPLRFLSAAYTLRESFVGFILLNGEQLPSDLCAEASRLHTAAPALQPGQPLKTPARPAVCPRFS